VADIRDEFDRTSLTDHGDALDPRNSGGPMLLDGVGTVSDMQDILTDVPPRDVADRLISRYFNSTQLHVRMFYILANTLDA
jgi:hypothetical protein